MTISPTRPMIMATHGVVTSGHYLASAAGLLTRLLTACGVRQVPAGVAATAVQATAATTIQRRGSPRRWSRELIVRFSLFALC